MTDWQPMDTAPKDRLIWVFSSTDSSSWVKPRLARWVEPIGNPGEWWQDERDCTLCDAQCWCEAFIPEPPDGAANATSQAESFGRARAEIERLHRELERQHSCHEREANNQAAEIKRLGRRISELEGAAQITAQGQNIDKIDVGKAGRL